MSKATPITPGTRVICRDAEWLVTSAPVVDFENNHQAVHCVGADDLVRGHEAIFLTQLDDITPVDPRATSLVADSSSGYKLSKLFLEAQLRKMPATGIEPDLDGMGAFQVMKFQEETVRRALAQLRPRLLLADAVGLGKTIQVGMVLTELMRRGRANRILVLARKSMLTQFQAELWNRFNIPLVRLDSAGIAKLRLKIPANKNPFEVYHRVIISLDTLKNVGRYEHFLKDTRWDVVVIDEAHNVAGASIPERNLSYRLARQLARRSDSMLLTTATPHNGKRETFGRLISLLDPSTIPDPNLKEYTADDIKNFFMMRFKEDVRADAGDMLSERKVVPITQTTRDASPQEETVYAAFAELRAAIQEARRKGTSEEEGWQNQALVQYGIYKLFLSSPEACVSTTEKRLKELTAKTPDSPEIPYLKRILSSLDGLTIRGSSRYKVLKAQLMELGWKGSSKCPRVLIFTEYRRTQDALAKAIAQDFGISYSDAFESQSTQPLAVIHGGTPDIHLMNTVEAFATGASPVRLLLATDVASEGINLHHECHQIIHYDLPWSIITLIQRNGRIDRLGQKKNPVLRYLMVNTRQGLLTGDHAIFERLIAKVEEINRLRQSGESVLQLYDPKAEEEYIAEKGVLAGNADVLQKSSGKADPDAAALEAMLAMANQAGHDEYLQYLLGGSGEEVQPAQPIAAAKPHEEQRVRLFADRQFLIDGYRYLAAQSDGWQPLQEQGNLMIVTPPKELKRRLGASDSGSDVIFGSTAIPEESWPSNGEFRLTADPSQVNLAIESARHTSGYWSKELLCSEQHPILQWITERLLMQMKRGEAPLVVASGLAPGELCFCFIGQVSSRAGTPLVVDAHAVTFARGGKTSCLPLKDALNAARFDTLVNTGEMPNLQAAQLLVASAVEQSLNHLRMHKSEREKQLMPILRKEERRLREWRKRREELLTRRIAELGESHPTARRYKNELQNMEEYIKDRELNWRNTHFLAAPEPSTQLVLVLAGKN